MLFLGELMAVIDRPWDRTLFLYPWTSSDLQSELSSLAVVLVLLVLGLEWSEFLEPDDASELLSPSVTLSSSCTSPSSSLVRVSEALTNASWHSYISRGIRQLLKLWCIFSLQDEVRSGDANTLSFEAEEMDVVDGEGGIVVPGDEAM